MENHTTLILGMPGSGKSALVRKIEHLLQGVPHNTIDIGGNEVEDLENNSKIISRLISRRKKGINIYSAHIPFIHPTTFYQANLVLLLNPPLDVRASNLGISQEKYCKLYGKNATYIPGGGSFSDLEEAFDCYKFDLFSNPL